MKVETTCSQSSLRASVPNSSTNVWSTSLFPVVLVVFYDGNDDGYDDCYQDHVNGCPGYLQAVILTFNTPPPLIQNRPRPKSPFFLSGGSFVAWVAKMHSGLVRGWCLCVCMVLNERIYVTTPGLRHRGLSLRKSCLIFIITISFENSLFWDHFWAWCRVPPMTALPDPSPKHVPRPLTDKIVSVFFNLQLLLSIIYSVTIFGLLPMTAFPNPSPKLFPRPLAEKIVPDFS